jgi:hypothetical protein
MPLKQRVPKLKGFNNPFRVEYQAINLDTLNEVGLDEITPEALLSVGLVSKGALVKILGRGEVTKKLTVRAHAFSKSAEAAITAAGGTVEVLPKPFCVPRFGTHEPLIHLRNRRAVAEMATALRLASDPFRNDEESPLCGHRSGMYSRSQTSGTRSCSRSPCWRSTVSVHIFPFPGSTRTQLTE